MIQPYTKTDLERAEQIVRELHGLRGFDAWAERIAKEIAATREETTAAVALRAALTPFAAISLWRDKYPDGPDTLDRLHKWVKVRDVQAAREALEQSAPVGPPRDWAPDRSWESGGSCE